jgi:peroxiredoxin
MPKITLDRLSNLVFIFTCLILVGLASYRTAGSPRAGEAPRPADARVDPLPKGVKVPDLAEVSFGTSAVTVALVVQSSCRFCGDSMPFYRRLAKLRSAGNVQIVAVSLEPVDALREYVKKNEVDVDHVGHLTGLELQTTGTPTLVVIGRDGTVRGSWLGRLSASQESDVLKMISHTGRASASARATGEGERL